VHHSAEPLSLFRDAGCARKLKVKTHIHSLGWPHLPTIANKTLVLSRAQLLSSDHDITQLGSPAVCLLATTQCIFLCRGGDSVATSRLLSCTIPADVQAYILDVYVTEAHKRIPGARSWETKEGADEHCRPPQEPHCEPRRLPCTGMTDKSAGCKQTRKRRSASEGA
jgi:hypothetical protein